MGNGNKILEVPVYLYLLSFLFGFAIIIEKPGTAIATRFNAPRESDEVQTDRVSLSQMSLICQYVQMGSGPSLAGLEIASNVGSCIARPTEGM